MRTLVGLALVVLGAVAARADVIVLADGSKVEGKLVDVDSASVRFKGKAGQVETRARKEVAAVLFFQAAKSGETPAVTITDHVEMDGLALDGTLFRFARAPFGPFGMTNAVLVDSAGKLVSVATPRRIASINFGTWKAPPPPKPAKGAKPVKPAPPPKQAGPAELLASTLKALAAAKPENDVAALLYAADTANALVTDDAAKAPLADSVEKAKALLPEHEKRRLALGDVRLEPADFGREAPPIFDPDPDRPRAEGPDVYVYFGLRSTTGEVLGAEVRVYWRTKDGRAGFDENLYFTKTSAAQDADAVGFVWREHEIERVAVEIRVGGRVVESKEATVAGAKPSDKPWWNVVVERHGPKGFVVCRESDLERGRVTDTFWRRAPYESGAVDDPEDK